MIKPEDCVLFSGAANGAEAAFGAAAERFGIDEVNFTFVGHNDSRTRGIRVLTHEELKEGDVSLEYVSRLMNLHFTGTGTRSLQENGRKAINDLFDRSFSK